MNLLDLSAIGGMIAMTPSKTTIYDQKRLNPMGRYKQVGFSTWQRRDDYDGRIVETRLPHFTRTKRKG